MRFTTMVAAKIAKSGIKDINIGIREGILNSQLLLQLGFGKYSKEPDYPIQELFNKNNESHIYDILIPNNNTENENKFWNILESRKDLNIESVAENYVINGENDDSSYIPVGKFGILKTIDRNEIEGSSKY